MNEYRKHFDHLGNPIDQTVPLRMVDLVSIVFLVGVVSALLSGALT